MTEQNNSIEQREEGSPFFTGARGIAVRILSRFERSDAYLDKLVDYEFRTGNLTPLDRTLMTELLYGVIRWRGKLDFVLNGFYHGDYMKCLNVVKNALRVALYQILFLDKIPIPAAINESVELIKRIQGEKIAGIVNAVLRNISRNIENIRFPSREEDPVYYLTVMQSHPRWLVRRWLDRFGLDESEEFMIINNQRPLTTIRVNKTRAKTDEIIEILTERNIPFELSKYLEDSIIITSNKIKVPALDLFTNGFITIQDTSASLAVKLGNPRQGMSVLDLCAAPGGKTFYYSDLMKNNGRILAIDKFSAKINIINEGAERQKFTLIEAIMDDALTYQSEEKFDIVHADVPCSGLGTLSKKPDIKWKREREDIYKLQISQRNILENAVNFVKEGGALIYSTCTTEPEENTENAKWFLEKFPEFELDAAENYIHPELCLDGMMQTFPHKHGMDGAFAVRFVKKR